jgi:endonuclease/exonuclease/phosphatase family metal-dependent hydrolase
VVAAAKATDADVLVLQECWTPDADRAQSTAAVVAGALGYDFVEHPLARGRRAGPDPAATDRWMAPLDWRSGAHAIFLDSHRALPRRQARSARYADAAPGTWGIAVLSRQEVTAHRVLDLGHLLLDRCQRAAIMVELSGGPIVVGTHMSHLSCGSPVHFRRLARLLAPVEAPIVLAGDMNLWGPPVGLFFNGWRRPVRGRTWPAWRPHSQVDHLLVRGALAVRGGEVLPAAGSDHRAVRVDLDLL